MSREDMTCNEQINGLLRAMPSLAVIVFADGNDYRAALVDRPSLNTVQATECCHHPDEAIDRLHERYVADAQIKVDIASEHLSRLTTRIIPKDEPRPMPSGGEE